MATDAWNLTRFVEIIESWGLTDVALPFLLIFTIVFAILQKSRVLGEGRKNYNLIVSLVIGLSVVIPHVTGAFSNENLDPVLIINKALPTVSIIIVAIIMMLILIGIFGGEAQLLGIALNGWIAFISFILIVLVFGASAGWWNGWDWFNDIFGQEAIALIIIILVFGIIIGFITSDNEGEERTTFHRLGEDMKKVFGGGGGGH
ncbi:MAG: hypothetical protein ABIH34_02620 [Nanoarchaeota archaeon]